MYRQVIFAAQSNLHEGQRAKTPERLIGMYPETAPAGRSPVTLRSCPGLTNVVWLGGGRVEALLSTDDALYAVVNGTVVSWDGVTVTTLGSVPPGRASMAWNGTQIAVSAGGGYFVWDGTTFSSPSGGAFTGASSVAFLDGYIIRTEPNGRRMDVTNLLDATTIGALDVATAESKPDRLLRVMSVGGIVWALGESTVEAWQNAGSTGFPFTRLSSTVIEKGVRTSHDAAELDNSFLWISDEPKVYRQVDFAPQRVSTHAVESSIRDIETVCFTYQHEGHDFLVVRSDTRPAWVYDVATQSWHERATGKDGAWAATAAELHQGTWYAGTEDGYLCTFSGFQDQGEELHREAISRPLSQAGNRFSVNSVDVRVEVGGGGQFMYACSKDGGRTFSPERIRSLGGVGEYDRRVQINQQGQHREFALKLRCTDNVDFAIYDAGVEVS